MNLLSKRLSMRLYLAPSCLTLLWALAGVASAQPAAALPALIPAAAYGPQAIEKTALSPSGRWLAMTTGLGGPRTGLVVFDLKEMKAHASAARYTDADISDFWWVNDDRLVYDLIDKARGSGDQRWWPGLFSVNRDGQETRQLVKTNFLLPRMPDSIARQPLEPLHELLHIPANGGDEVIVGEWRYDSFNEFESINAKRLNVVTGRATSLSFGAPAHVHGWWFDPQGEPRAVVTRHKGRGAIHWRAPGSETWVQLVEYPQFEAPYAPAYTDAAGALFVTTPSGLDGVSVLKRFDFKTGQPEPEALVSAPGFDFTGSVVSETVGSRTLGVRVDTDAETTHWFDKRLAVLQTEADRRLPGRVNRLVCRRCDKPDMTVLIHSWSDRDPGQVWVHQVEANTWRKVGERRPDIDPRRMATVEFERVRSRDGLQIPVWVTSPAGRASGPRPAVVLVHGGPWVRHGHWAWNADAQFLASRGYVVIEPEFRGSTGYGGALYRAGWRQWGRAMQDDVADALAWAVGKGMADPAKVCIAGASYGGYATLMGLARDPTLYRCGVAWVAVTDPRLLFQWRRDSDANTESREYSLPQLVGDPVADAAMLDSVTPVLLAERIKAPLLLAFGGQDRRVPLVHGTRMRDALVAAGRPPEWVLYGEEGHGWLKVENQLDFARRLESFLAQHLK